MTGWVVSWLFLYVMTYLPPSSRAFSPCHLSKPHLRRQPQCGIGRRSTCASVQNARNNYDVRNTRRLFAIRRLPAKTHITLTFPLLQNCRFVAENDIVCITLFIMVLCFVKLILWPMDDYSDSSLIHFRQGLKYHRPIRWFCELEPSYPFHALI